MTPQRRLISHLSTIDPDVPADLIPLYLRTVAAAPPERVTHAEHADGHTYLRLTLTPYTDPQDATTRYAVHVRLDTGEYIFDRAGHDAAVAVYEQQVRAFQQAGHVFASCDMPGWVDPLTERANAARLAYEIATGEMQTLTSRRALVAERRARALAEVVGFCDGNVTRAAVLLGLSQPRAHHMLSRYGLLPTRPPAGGSV